MAQFYGDWIYDEEYKHWRSGLSYGIWTETDTQATIWIRAELDAGYYYLNSSVEGEDKTLLGRVIYKIGDQEQIVREVHIPFPFIEGVGNKVFDNFDFSVDKTTEEQNVVMSVIIQGIKYEDFYWDRDLNQPEKSTVTRTITIPSLPTYTISYDANGGSEAPTPQIKYFNESVTLKTQQPTRSGYKFLGWGLSATATTAKYLAEGNNIYSDNADLDLYAVWQKIYTINYNMNGGTPSSIPSQQKLHGESVILSQIQPTKTGYIFEGWATSDNSTVVNYTPGSNYNDNADLNLYAVWTIITFTITYNPNGGSWSGPATQTKEYGTNLILSNIIPERTGYTFSKWTIEQNGTGNSYYDEDNLVYTEEQDAILYAQWQPLSYSVSYNFNGGNIGVISHQSKYYDIPLVLTSKIPSKTGYIFTNWNTLPDGTGDVYLPNDIYNENKVVILYAQWREKPKGWINRIKLLTGSENDRVENEFTLGATFDQVQYSENNAMTLLDFVNIIKKFFKSKMFMHYCGQEPTDNVMEWYQVVATDVNPTKDELNAILG